MIRRTSICIVLAACSFIATPTAHADEFTSISISEFANANLQLGNAAFPSGSPVILAGVPFDIPATGNNYIETAAFQGTVVLEFPIRLNAVAGVHTLINTYWGVNGPGALASLTFHFDDGSSVEKLLVGNDDIRDFYQNFYTNSINGTTTINAFTTDNDGSAGPNLYRLDKQFVDLSAHSDRLLVSMTLTDWGSNGVQRTFLSGITVQTMTPQCIPADLNCDGVVNGADLGMLLAAWGTAQPNAPADLNHDGAVDGADLGLLLAAWGP